MAMASSPTRLQIDTEHQWLERCATHKRGYPSKAVALDVAEQMMERGAVYPGCHITSYACAVCGEWHVTNRVIVPIATDGR